MRFQMYIHSAFVLHLFALAPLANLNFLIGAPFSV